MQGTTGPAGPAPAQQNRPGGCLVRFAAVAFGCAVLFSGCVTMSGYDFAYQATCGPNPPTQWRLECTYVALAVSTLCLIPALVLMLRGRVTATQVAVLLAFASMAASFFGWLLPVFASALC
jgi:hypothetical protein